MSVDRPTITTRRARVVRQLCIGVIALAGLEFAVATTAMTFRQLPASTDFATYYLAGLQARDGLSPYDAAALAARGHDLGFEHEQFPFLYPPPFALAMQPLTRLSYPRARQAWVILVTLALFTALVMNGRLMRTQSASLDLQSPVSYWIVLAAFVPAALNSTGIHNDIRAGSVATLLYLALVMVAWGAASRRAGWTAGGLAAAAVLKLTPVVALAWAAWRGARRAVVGCMALLVLAGGLAVAHWGWSIGSDYVRAALMPALASEAPLPMNQSLDAMLSRLLVPSEVVRSPFDLPRLKMLLSLGLAASIAWVTVWSLRRRPRHVALLPVELGFVMLAVLMLMKLTWLHTLAAILFVWPCVMLPILRAAERGAAWALRAGIAACVGFFLSSAHIPVLWNGLRHGAGVLLISVHCVGLFVLWLVCRHVLEHEADIIS